MRCWQLYILPSKEHEIEPGAWHPEHQQGLLHRPDDRGQKRYSTETEIWFNDPEQRQETCLEIQYIEKRMVPRYSTDTRD
jgi:hypothetical protein